MVGETGCQADNEDQQGDSEACDDGDCASAERPQECVKTTDANAFRHDDSLSDGFSAYRAL